MPDWLHPVKHVSLYGHRDFEEEQIHANLRACLTELEKALPKRQAYRSASDPFDIRPWNSINYDGPRALQLVEENHPAVERAHSVFHQIMESGRHTHAKLRDKTHQAAQLHGVVEAFLEMGTAVYVPGTSEYAKTAHEWCDLNLKGKGNWRRAPYFEGFVYIFDDKKDAALFKLFNS